MHFLLWVRCATRFLPYLAEPLADQAQTVSRRVEKFAELMQSVWVSRNDYERRVRLVGLLDCNDTSFLTPFYEVAARARRNTSGLGYNRI